MPSLVNHPSFRIPVSVSSRMRTVKVQLRKMQPAELRHFMPSRWKVPRAAAATRKRIAKLSNCSSRTAPTSIRRAAGDRGQTPLDDAVANKNDAVAAVLREHGAQDLNPLTKGG